MVFLTEELMCWPSLTDEFRMKDRVQNGALKFGNICDTYKYVYV
jgi:hypothetical protein